MKERPEDRLKRLKARKAELFGEMKTLRLNGAKWEVKNDEVLRITTKIMELEER